MFKFVKWKRQPTSEPAPTPTPTTTPTPTPTATPVPPTPTPTPTPTITPTPTVTPTPTPTGTPTPTPVPVQYAYIFMSRYNPLNRPAASVTTSPSYGSTTVKTVGGGSSIQISYTGLPQYFSSWQLVGGGLVYTSGNSTSLTATLAVTTAGDKTIICRLK